MPEIDQKELDDLKATAEAAKKTGEELDRYKLKHEASEKHLKEQEKLAKEEAAKAAKAAEEAAKKSGDVEALEKSWQEKLNAKDAENADSLSKYQKTIADLTTGSAAKSMAAKLALPGSADVLLPHIASRLQVEMADGSPIVRVLDIHGKPSALSVEDLEKEIGANKAFAPLLVGSNASGSGNMGDKSKGGGKTMTRADFDAKNPTEKMAFMKDGGKVIDS